MLTLFVVSTQSDGFFWLWNKYHWSGSTAVLNFLQNSLLFKGIQYRLRSNLNVCNFPVLLDYLQTTPLEVFDLLCTLNCCKTSGPDMICPCLLKEEESEISCSLSNLFTKSVQDSVLPVDWVRANVCPVYKRGDKQSVSNYYPISLTIIVSKLLEKIVCKYLYAMLESHNLLHAHQFSFHKKWSTTTHLMSAVDDWASTLDCNQSTLFVLRHV